MPAVAAVAAVMLASIIIYLSGSKSPMGDRHPSTQQTTGTTDSERAPQPVDLRCANVGAADPAPLLDAALRSLPSMLMHERDAFVARLISELRAAGPRGLRAVAEFLQSGRDVPLRDEYALVGNRVVAPSTLRVALLDALAGWEGSAAVLLEFLRSRASGWEIVLAIRNLELEFPSAYRAESIAALKSALAQPAEATFGTGGESHVFATVARLAASELLPQAEHLAVATSNVPRYVEMLSQFPAETRVPALASVFSRPEPAAEIEAAPQTVNQWSFAEPQTRAFIRGVFRSGLVLEQRVALLDGLDTRPPILPVEQSLFATAQHAREADRAANAAALAEAQARKAFLAEIVADGTQPAEVRAAAKDAQNRITADLAGRQTAARTEANRLVEIDFAQGTGKAQIKGRRIEQIELQSPTLIEPPIAAGSTESPPR
jgi:hypothetical protein